MRRAFVALAFAAGLSGCAQLAPMPSGEPSPGGFELSGRFAVRYANESATGAVQWRHSQAADDLLITNPLGQGVARITRSGQEFELETSQGERYHAPDAESLTQQVLGWSLPLHGLPDWVLARPLPGEPAEVARSDNGRVTSLSQDGWRIDYDDYSGERPSRLTLSRTDLRIRLVIESWRGV